MRRFLCLNESPAPSPLRRACVLAAPSWWLAVRPAVAQTVPPASGEVVGTGATFPALVYQHWADQQRQLTGMGVVYKPAGSSAGVKAVVAGQVDFGATDVPLKAAVLAERQLVQFPTLVGGVVPVVNLPGVPSGALRLTPELLAQVFAQRITRWNHPAIAALNPGLSLPDLGISRVVRADGSGTTEVFVHYLHLAAPETAAAIERQGGKAGWPGAPLKAEGNGGVARAVKANVGAIAYLSSDHVLKEGLNPVSLRNLAGVWMKPTRESFSAAVRSAGLFKDELTMPSLLNLDDAAVWPIVTATYIVVPKAPADSERAGRALNFFYRSFLLGDKAVADSGFAPLPVKTQARIVTLLAGLRGQDGRRLPVWHG